MTNKKTIYDTIDCLINDKIAGLIKHIRSLEESLESSESRQTDLNNMINSSQKLKSQIESINKTISRIAITLEELNSESTNISNLKHLFKT